MFARFDFMYASVVCVRCLKIDHDTIDRHTDSRSETTALLSCLLLVLFQS